MEITAGNARSKDRVVRVISREGRSGLRGERVQLDRSNALVHAAYHVLGDQKLRRWTYLREFEGLQEPNLENIVKQWRQLLE